MEEIRCKPGILKSELYNMNIGHERSIYIQVDQLIYEGSVVRAWDKITRSYRFYPKGQEPPIHELKVYKKSLYSRYTGIAIPNDVHGEKFMMVFDEAFGILYIDLKILGMAAQQLGEQKK